MWCLGAALSCFVANMVNSILGSGYMDGLPGVALDFYTVALVFAIVGAVLLVMGFLCLALNVKRAKEGSGDSGNANKVVLLLIAFTVVTVAVMGGVGAGF